MTVEQIGNVLGVSRTTLYRMPDSLDQLDVLLLTVDKPRVVQRDGIRFQGGFHPHPWNCCEISTTGKATGSSRSNES